jgi:hypothetical protein
MWHHVLEMMSSVQVSTDQHHSILGSSNDMQLKRVSTIEMPHLIGLNAVKRGEVAGFEEVIDAG